MVRRKTSSDCGVKMNLQKMLFSIFLYSFICTCTAFLNVSCLLYSDYLLFRNCFVDRLEVFFYVFNSCLILDEEEEKKEEKEEEPKIPDDFYYEYDKFASRPVVTAESGLPEDMLTLQYPSFKLCRCI